MVNVWNIVRNFFVRNWHLKLLSLVLAAISFYAIRNATGFEVPFEIPVHVEIEKGIAVLEQDPRTVEVTFRGSQEDLLRLEPSKLKIELKSKAETLSGPEIIDIRPQDIKGPSSVRVVRIKPDRVRLAFDREIEKQVNIAKPRIIGKPLLGHAEIDYDPKIAIIKGSKQRLQDKDVVETEPIDVEGRVESFSKELRILSPKDMSGAQINPPVVQVKVNIITESGSLEWTNIPVRVVMKPEEVKNVFLDPQYVTVKIQGRSDLLGELSTEMADAFVDCSGLMPSGTYELPVRVYLSRRVDVATEVYPKVIKVTIREVRK